MARQAASSFSARAMIDQREEHQARLRLDFGNRFIELRLRAHQGIEMLHRIDAVELRRHRTADGDQCFACRIGDEMQVEIADCQG